MKWRPKSFFMGFDLLELLLIYLFMAMPFVYIYIQNLVVFFRYFLSLRELLVFW